MEKCFSKCWGSLIRDSIENSIILGTGILLKTMDIKDLKKSTIHIG